MNMNAGAEESYGRFSDGIYINKKISKVSLYL